MFRRSAVKNPECRKYSSNVTYNKQVSIGLALSVLEGAPITSYRGIMADVSQRHFKLTKKKTLRVMAKRLNIIWFGFLDFLSVTVE